MKFLLTKDKPTRRIKAPLSDIFGVYGCYFWLFNTVFCYSKFSSRIASSHSWRPYEYTDSWMSFYIFTIDLKMAFTSCTSVFVDCQVDNLVSAGLTCIVAHLLLRIEIDSQKKRYRTASLIWWGHSTEGCLFEEIFDDTLSLHLIS